MKLVTFSTNGMTRIGIVSADGVIDVARHGGSIPLEMLDLISEWDRHFVRLTAIARAQPDLPLSQVKLHAPVPRPRKILALGLNYADHIAETGAAMPTVQTWFAKMPTAASGPFDPIELPAVSEQLDHECELVFFIGKTCRNVPRTQAKDVIFGYCVGNDVTVRDWQFASSQWVLGKSFDSHAPMGPWLTTADEIDPHTLGIRLSVNGEMRQSSDTRHLVFDCYAQVEHLSKAMTLEPGDVIFTGTCGGVGISRKPPLWLASGDVVRVEIDGLGHIENVVVPGSSATRIGS